MPDLTNYHIDFVTIEKYIGLFALILGLVGIIAYLMRRSRLGFVLLSGAAIIAAGALWLPATQSWAPCGVITVLNCEPARAAGKFDPLFAAFLTVAVLAACLAAGRVAYVVAHRNDELNAALAMAKAEHWGIPDTGAYSAGGTTEDPAEYDPDYTI